MTFSRMWRLRMYLIVSVGALFLCACGGEPQPEVSRIAATPLIADADGWSDLSADASLAAWTMNTPDGWTLVDGILTGGGKGFIWIRETFGDFTLECEYRLGKGGNSGIFFRVGDTADPVQTGFEVQIYDPPPHDGTVKNDPGAVYDLVAPSGFAQNPPGVWNRAILTCNGPFITVEMNGVSVVDGMNLDYWDTAGINPDGTKNKFTRAIRDSARSGHIGLQDPGDKVSYRNLRIKRL